MTEQIYSSAAQQKIALLCDQGLGHEEAVRYDKALAENSSDFRFWLLCTAAHEFAGENEQALDVVIKGMKHFPGKASLYTHAGDICRSLQRYDEAFTYWHKALELDSSYLDAVYSMGFCYEELSRYEEAYQVWTGLVRELDCRGLVIEREYPAQMAAACQKHMK